MQAYRQCGRYLRSLCGSCNGAVRGWLCECMTACRRSLSVMTPRCVLLAGGCTKHPPPRIKIECCAALLRMGEDGATCEAMSIGARCKFGVGKIGAVFLWQAQGRQRADTGGEGAACQGAGGRAGGQEGREAAREGREGRAAVFRLHPLDHTPFWYIRVALDWAGLLVRSCVDA